MAHEFKDILAGARGFMQSRVILSAAELDLFTALDEEPRDAVELARDRGLDARATARLLDCLVGFGFLDKPDGRYRLSDKGAPYSSRHPESVQPMALHMSRLWNTWGGLTEVVRHGGDTLAEPGIHMDEAEWKAFIGAMHVVGRELSEVIVKAYDAGAFKRLLDIGGGSGTYTLAFLQRYPGLSATLFDLPHVLPMAEERLAKAGLLDRARLAAGDFYADPLPTGCDLALLSAIIHQNSPALNQDLYAKVHAALEPGGVLLIRDHVMDASRAQPTAGAVFALNMLVNRNGGDTYTFEEIKAQLDAVGFLGARLIRQGPDMDCLVEAKKPSP